MTGVDLVVPNIAEFNLGNPALRLGPATERVAATMGAHLADAAVLWSTVPRVLVLPAGTDPAWFADIHAALELAPPPVVSPAPRSGLLLADLMHDPAALSSLHAALAGRGPVRLLYWGATPEVFLLASTLRGWGLRVDLDGVPADGYWASLYLDSKLSCLDLARQMPGVRVPAGLTVSSLPELRGALDHMLAKHRHVIVRSPYGVGGEGSAVVRFGGRGVGDLWTALQRDEFFRGFPLLVQEYVPHARGTGCPAVDLYVAADGVRETVCTAMTVAGHRFRSVCVGAGALPAVVARDSVRVAEAIGEAARALGFRGWMCVDYVLGADGDLYVTEINARRSGAMHAIGLLRHLPGGDRLTAASHDTASVDAAAPLSYVEHVRPVFARLWQRGVTAYPTATRGLAFDRPALGVLAVGATAAEAEAAVGQALAELRAPVAVGASRVQ